MRRAAREVDDLALEQRDDAATVPEPASTAPVQGQTIDGRVVRGAGTHGQEVRLVASVRHSGVVLARTMVADKTNEIIARHGHFWPVVIQLAP